MKKLSTLVVFLFLADLLSFGLSSGVMNPKQTFVQKNRVGVSLNDQNVRQAEMVHSPNIHAFAIPQHSVAASKKLDRVLVTDWNIKKNQWINSSKSEFSYLNFNGEIKCSKITDFEWDTLANKWEIQDMMNYTYEANGDLVQVMDSEWKGGTDTWVADTKSVYSFNADGTTKLNQTYLLDSISKEWHLMMKTEFSYNTSGKLVQKSTSVKEGESANAWILFYKSDYTYTDHGGIKEQLDYSMDYKTFQMALSGKTEYSYDSQQVLNKIIDSGVDPFTGQMQFMWKSDFTFESNGNLKTEIYSDWESSLNTWKTVSKDEMVYNNLYSFSDIIYPYLFDGSEIYLKHMPTEVLESTWNPTLSKWETSSKTVLDYSDKNLTSTEIINIETRLIYPNPTNGSIQIRVAENPDQMFFELFDLQGKKLQRKAVVNGQKIDLESIQSGVYVYRISTNGRINTGKLVKY